MSLAIKRVNTAVSEETRQVVESFIAGGTIVAGDVVKFDVSQTDSDRALYVVAGTASGLCFGVALEAATSGARVRVAVKGYVEGASCNGSVTQGASLAGAANADLAPYVGNEAYPAIGVALEDDAGAGAGDPADVWLFGLGF